jgi:tyrosine-protein phosphatase YwqE
MFFWEKKNIPSIDLSWLHTDMHSHLLPGIDDGAPDIATSLELIKALASLGYKKLITTPHVLWEIYPNTSEIITQQSAILKEAIAKEGIDIQLESAAEYFIDENFENLLKNQVPLLPIHYNMVLVEFSMITAPLDLKEILFEMQLQNYQPVIAHPERYIYLKNKKDFFEELKDHGCFFQLNLLSLLGHYGNSVQELADYLIKNNYYNFAGTDAHNIKHITALQKLAGSSLFKRLQESDTIKNYIL